MAKNLAQTPTDGIQFVDEASGAYGSIVMSLNWTAARGATNTIQVGVIPANTRIQSISIVVPVASNAATTANVSVGLVGGSNTFFTAAQDVKTAIGNFSQTPTANWILTASQKVSCTYTETGTASTLGTIFVHVNYVVL